MNAAVLAALLPPHHRRKGVSIARRVVEAIPSDADCEEVEISGGRGDCPMPDANGGVRPAVVRVADDRVESQVALVGRKRQVDCELPREAALGTRSGGGGN